MTKGDQRYAAARALIDNGMSIGEALQRVADDEGVQLNAVRTSYYRIARNEGTVAPRAKRKRAKAKAPQRTATTNRAVDLGTVRPVDLGNATLKQLVDDLERAQARLVAYCLKREIVLTELRSIVGPA